MVTPLHHLRICAGLATISVFLCQCETQRTVKSTRSTISFDQRTWGGQGSGDNSQEIRSKFAERGYQVQEDGTIKADKPDLYSTEKLNGFEKQFGTKEARLKKDIAKTNEFKTPEYLVRQDFKGDKTARESGTLARESNSEKSQDRQSGKFFKSKTKSSGELAAYGTKDYGDGNNAFKTKTDRATSAAVANSANASGTTRPVGYQDNISMSMDDVKKMLNPGSYARGTGIID